MFSDGLKAGVSAAARLLLVCAASQAAIGLAHSQSQVYRCTDTNGKPVFQGQPCEQTSGGKRQDAGVSAPASTTQAPRSRQVEARSESWRPTTGADAPAPAAYDRARGPSPSQGFAQPPSHPTPGNRDLPRATATPAGAQQWGKEADVIIVSGYETTGRIAKVHLTHSARPVLLVLSSYERTQWKVLPAPGTQIKAIVAGSYNNKSEVIAPPGVPVAYDNLPYAVEAENINFRELLGKLSASYGVTKVTGFRGAYRLPEDVPVFGPFLPDPRLSLVGILPETPRVRMNFDLLSTDGRRLPWTNSGPKDGKTFTGIVAGPGASGAQATAVRDDGGEAFRLTGNGSTLLWFPQGLERPSQKMQLPPDLPELSWGSGMAWDQKTGILSIVSFGGEGYFYRYDTRKRQWLGARSLQNRDLLGLAHDPQAGGYVAISNQGELVSFNERGELDEVRSLAEALPDLGSTFDRGNRRLENLTLAANGNVIAIVNVRNASVTHIWTYERASRKAQLTYKAPG